VSTNYFVDVELPNNIEFTYRVRARFDDVVPSAYSAYSNLATTTALNEAPQAVADPTGAPTVTYPVKSNTTTTFPAPGVLANDTDVDSSVSSFRAVLYTVNFPVTGCQNGGTLTLNTNQSFTYKPKNGYSGPDKCQYIANDGVWTLDATVPMSPNSNMAEVFFTVSKK
jgi:hypothetical protein